MNGSSSSDNTEKALEEFRTAWKQEVQKKHVHDKPKGNDIVEPKKMETAEEEGLKEIIDKTESLSVNAPVTAMDHYVIAIDNERQGKLGPALAGYRRAFKLDPDIDYAYQRHYQETILPNIQKNKSQPKKEEDGEFKHVIPFGKEYTAPSATRKDPLQDLIMEFSNDPELSYIPLLDYKPVSIAKLPSEIMLQIVRLLVLYSGSTIPFFALTCKKFFLLSRDPSVWQYACVRVFREPDMSLEESRIRQSEYVEKYDGHWMRMYIDRPRIRYDGVYISTCQYVRPGTSETAWESPIHLVTYYRYLRFFPDGTILKHLTTEEPKRVVKLLVPGFNKNQTFHGKFVIRHDNQVMIVMNDGAKKKDSFNLNLEIKTTQRGKHNKLKWIDYSCMSYLPDRNGDNFDTKLFRPFFFSHVRSYKVNYEDDLSLQ